MSNNQTDPLQSIALAIRSIVPNFGINTTILGWPDPKEFEVDGYLPALAIFPVSDTGKHMVSREQIHAVVANADGVTATVYREQQRIIYTLQFSLFTKTEEDRSNIGWSFQQYFSTLANAQLTIGTLGNDADGNPIETALFQKYHGQRNPQGETGFFQRDMEWEVTARVLDAETAYLLKQLQIDENVGMTDVNSAPAAPTQPSSTTTGTTRTING